MLTILISILIGKEHLLFIGTVLPIHQTIVNAFCFTDILFEFARASFLYQLVYNSLSLF